ncbi:protein bicaudal C homolog 1-B [Electrophorus electricus]|uniref:protein bicaudal C homolog 1-B n=1 Tax=Electrophorus electricus TaxID=8005 RepID=UPI0015CFDCB7|nr:protein bicaudal C homolog 1-B [Electrophorus electricus]
MSFGLWKLRSFSKFGPLSIKRTDLPNAMDAQRAQAVPVAVPVSEADSPGPVSEADSPGPVSEAPSEPDWTEERFRVDRKKLEIMFLAASGERERGGEDFFQKIMNDTSTQIAWPSKLKIGAKSKKDPHIKVSGSKRGVKEARDRILSVLDTKSNRVTLKMDVSHTEHSHVIGKGGNNIRRVMEETACHIHFPDSNRNSNGDKSNQVSIAGQPTGVEVARAKIRELMPLVLMFDCANLPELLDCRSPVVQHISQSCNVSITCRPPSHLYGNSTAVVRGDQSNTAAVKRATALLLDHLAGPLASSVLVSSQLEVSPQHQPTLLGSSALRRITQLTDAHIHFPELPAASHKHPHLPHSTLYIHGTIDAVCEARKQLMGCLPLVLMFDLKVEVEVETQFITTLMEQLDVFISMKPKPKQPSKSVIVKSSERNAGNMFKARHLLLAREIGRGSTPHPSFSPGAPPPAVAGDPSPAGLDVLASAGLGLSTLGLLGTSGTSADGSSTPQAHPTSNTPQVPPAHDSIRNGYSSHSPAHAHGPQSQPVHTHAALPLHGSSPWSCLFRASGGSADHMFQSVSQGSHSGPPLSGVHSYTKSLAHSHALSPAHTHNPPPGLTSIHKPVNTEQLKTHISRSVYREIPSVSLESVLGSTHRDSVQEINGRCQTEAISSKSTSDEGSDTFVEVGMPRSPSHSANGTELKHMLASCTGKRQTVALLKGAKNSHLHSECLLRDSESEAVADKRAPGSERAERNRLTSHIQAYDYEQKKLLATKAMLKKPVVTEVRTPTSTWSGLGFSKSMPAESISQLRPASRPPHTPVASTAYEGPSLSMSCEGSIEALSNSCNGENWREGHDGADINGNGTAHIGTDLPELFSTLGLGKYIDVFQQQEIDLQTFVTLTDLDLKELGVTTFGARRKMLLAISELSKNQRKLFEVNDVQPSFPEVIAGRRAWRQVHVPSVSGRW